mgnify:CR=1 FL=1
MFYFLSKTVYLLVMPLTWVFALLFIAIFSKKTKRKNQFLVTGVVLLFVFSNPYFSTFLMKSWELPAKPFATYSKSYQTAIVLGGVTDIHKLPRDRVFTKQGADRILHAAELLKKGIVKHILVSGGTFSKEENATSEALQMKKILLQCGIPDSLIIVEGNSLNTRENALKSAEVLGEVGWAEKEHLLVTSAFHMRRAKSCFKKVGLKVDAFSTDFYTSDGRLGVSFLEVIYPNEDSLFKTFRVFREVLGYVVYKALAYA